MRATAPITRQDKDQWKCVSRDSEKKGCKHSQELCYSTGSRSLLYVLRKAPLSEETRAKTRPDVNETGSSWDAPSSVGADDRLMWRRGKKTDEHTNTNRCICFFFPGIRSWFNFTTGRNPANHFGHCVLWLWPFFFFYGKAQNNQK